MSLVNNSSREAECARVKDPSGLAQVLDRGGLRPTMRSETKAGSVKAVLKPGRLPRWKPEI
jgi:hypothetical protein